MIGYTQVVHEFTQLSGFQMNHVYIKSALLEEFPTKAIFQNIHLSDHDVL